MLFFGFSLCLLIEFIQYFSKRGIFEVDDIISNTVGTWIGIQIYKSQERNHLWSTWVRGKVQRRMGRSQKALKNVSTGLINKAAVIYKILGGKYDPFGSAWRVRECGLERCHSLERCERPRTHADARWWLKCFSSGLVVFPGANGIWSLIVPLNICLDVHRQHDVITYVVVFFGFKIIHEIDAIIIVN